MEPQTACDGGSKCVSHTAEHYVYLDPEKNLTFCKENNLPVDSGGFNVSASASEMIGSTFQWAGTEYVYIQENGVVKSDFTWTTSSVGESAYMWTNPNLIDAEKDSETMENFYLYMNTCWAAGNFRKCYRRYHDCDRRRFVNDLRLQ